MRCGKTRCCRCGKVTAEPPHHHVRFSAEECRGEQAVGAMQHALCEGCYPAFRVAAEMLMLAGESNEEMDRVTR